MNRCVRAPAIDGYVLDVMAAVEPPQRVGHERSLFAPGDVGANLPAGRDRPVVDGDDALEGTEARSEARRGIRLEECERHDPVREDREAWCGPPHDRLEVGPHQHRAHDDGGTEGNDSEANETVHTPSLTERLVQRYASVHPEGCPSKVGYCCASI